MASTRFSGRQRRGLACGAAILALVAVAVLGVWGHTARSGGAAQGTAAAQDAGTLQAPREQDDALSSQDEDEGHDANADAGEGEDEQAADVVGDPWGLMGDIEGGQWEWRTSSQDLPQAAAELLEGYQASQDCVLRYAGYLDVFGNVWGCAVEGSGWVDVCVVGESWDGKSSTVGTLRLDAGDWEAAYG